MRLILPPNVGESDGEGSLFPGSDDRPERPGSTLRPMRVSIRLFAGLRERAGTGERELELAEGSTVRDVWDSLALGDEPPGLLYAVNREYAPRDQGLADGDEVALIPPVSGGAFRLVEGPLDLEAVVAKPRTSARARSQRSRAPSASSREAAT